MTLAVEELAFLALSLPRHRRAPEPVAARAVGWYLEKLSADTAATSGAAPVGAALHLPDYPHTSLALGALATTVTHVRAAEEPARSGRYRAGSAHRR